MLEWLIGHSNTLENVESGIKEASNEVKTATQLATKQYKELKEAKEELDKMYYIIRTSCDEAEGMIYFKEYVIEEDAFLYKFANKHMCEVFFHLDSGCEVDGLSDVELINRFYESKDKTHTFLDLVIAADRFTLRRGKITRFYEIGKIADTEIIFDTSRTPIFDSYGLPLGIVGITKDVSCLSTKRQIKNFADKGYCIELLPDSLYWQKEVSNCFV